MEESLILVLDYEKICRLCLHTTSAMSDIFDSDGENSLILQILYATGLDITQGDGLPTKICHKCRYIVELSCELRDTVMKAHKLLTDPSGPQLMKQYLDRDNMDTSKLDTDRFDINKENSNVLVHNEQALLEVELVDNTFENMEFKEDTNVAAQTDMSEKLNISTERKRKTAPKHLTCQICLCWFTTEQQVQEHVHTHYTHSQLTPYLQLQRPYTCEACQENGISKKQLIVHHRQHLQVNPFVCKHPGCKFVGKNQESLRHHVVVHSSRSLVCERCGASFRRGWELRQHAHRHTPAPAHCAHCRRTFRNHITYKAHLLTHHRPPRYRCTYRGCPKAYQSRGALAAHARAHAADKLYRCTLCSAAAYTSASLLNRHVRMHGRVRVSRCDKCPATFEEYGAFYRHRVRLHGHWLPHRCIGCNQGYQSESRLEKHTQRCELAIRMRAYDEQSPQNDPVPLPGTGPVDKHISQDILMEKQVIEFETGDLIDRLKGQSFVVQPGNIRELSKDNSGILELPADGLLYIEVEPDAEEGAWRQ